MSQSGAPVEPGYMPGDDLEPPASVPQLDEAAIPAENDDEPRIDIRLGRELTSGWMRNRLDLLMNGLVVADQPIEAVSLIVDGTVRSMAQFGRAAQTRQGFRLAISQRKDLTSRLTTFEVAALTSDGRERRIAFAIATDSDDPGAAHLVDGPVGELAFSADALPPVLLYVETAVVDPRNVLHVGGWAVGLNAILAVQVFIDGRRLGSARLGQSRDDIAAAFQNYPNAGLSGFALSEALPEGAVPQSITIEAIDLSGSVNHVVIPVERGPALVQEPAVRTVAAPPPPQAQPPADPRRAIHMHCDEASLTTDGELLVSGWVVCATGVAAVAVSLDDVPVGDAIIGLPRPDVAEGHPGIPQAQYSGFRLQHQLAAPVSGDHNVNVWVRNGLDDLRVHAVTVTATEPLPASSRAAAVDPHEFQFQIDNPVVVDGVVAEPVAGHLVIDGWALARSGVQEIEVSLDGRSLGKSYYGAVRRDVEAAFPDWEGALRSGFTFHCPPSSLESGSHTMLVQLRAKSGRSFDTAFRIDVEPSEDSNAYATIRRRMSRVEIDLYQDMLDRLTCHPHFRLLLPARAPIEPEKIEATLRALGEQVYRDWQLVIVTDAAKPTGLLAMAERVRLRDRVTIIQADAAPAAIMPTGKDGASCLVGVLLPGDELGCDALAEIAVARGLHANGQLYYADEDRISPSSHLREPFFKPDWSPDLLLSTNYIGRPWFVTPETLIQAGITPRSLLAPHGDYDAVLRCTELASRIHHLPKLLCRRGDADEVDESQEQRVLQSALTRRGIEGDVLPGCVTGTWRVRRTTTVKGKVSIIIPTCAGQGYVATCLKTLRSTTAYPDYEIICIDNIPPSLPEWKKLVREGADKVVDIPEKFNWSRFNNRAAEQAEGEFLLFLNDDIEVLQEDWLDALLEHARRPEVGVVGPQLLYPDGKVQHAGIFLITLGVGRHAFRFLEADDPGYFGLALTQRNVIAVTGACMLMRREVFDRIGHFDEAHEVVNNDVDCCLRVWQEGLSIVYTPYAQLIHHELASRAKMEDVFDVGHFAKQWRTLYASGDPYFSPRLSKYADEYRPDTEPAMLICPGRPLFRKDDIQRILVVKLDHIGDLVISLAAMRRLRRHFPEARIHLLAGAAARSFVADEDCVDEFIEFAFFHARSGLGQKELMEEDLRALGERLEPYRFDLAIDLRKHTDTRDVLKCVPARFRAGFSYQGRFPWLDVALEWEGEKQFAGKHTHVSDDLLRLVDAVAMAGEADRFILSRALVENGKLPARVPADVRALFDKPVVAIQPGVGAIMRQWLPDYFAMLIDLLIEKNGVNVVLIGGPDEAELAEEVLRSVVNHKSVVSVVGRTSLSDLTGLLRACALYVGNNSGPKHIAAALGVPTIGIHSGVVDAVEWGPIGPRAIALQRSMVCSPCYLVKPEDCVRDMACLKKLEPAVVHQYCEMMLARAVPAAPAPVMPQPEPPAMTVPKLIAGKPAKQAKPGSGAAPKHGRQVKRRRD